MKNLNTYITEKFKITKDINTELDISSKNEDFIKDLSELVSNIIEYPIKVKLNKKDTREIQICFKKEDFMTNSPRFFNTDKKIENTIANSLDKLKLKSCKCIGDGIRRKIYVYPEYE